jgi:signal transduction histidine kinase
VEDLAILADRLTASGMAVEIETTGSASELTPAQHLTVYRLAQESLTNAFKHADRAKGARVHLVWTATSVEFRVRSSLPPRALPLQEEVLPAGRGVAGMQARAAAAGGWVETIRSEETFEVMAFLPSAGADWHPESAPGEPEPRALEGARP